ncbi:MAG: Sec-independent protein translocase protein TatB [Hydrogenophilus sp.]|nr:Sec-independent protein translocase protein TatB [Hydrogenophilus sp.]
MFDVGFSELVVIGLVALIVVGPERLPRVARTVGHLLGRMQRYAASVKADIEREIQLEELKRLEAQIQAQVKGFESELRAEAARVEGEIATAQREVEQTLKENEEEKTALPPPTGSLPMPPERYLAPYGSEESASLLQEGDRGALLTDQRSEVQVQAGDSAAPSASASPVGEATAANGAGGGEENASDRAGRERMGGVVKERSEAV